MNELLSDIAIPLKVQMRALVKVSKYTYLSGLLL